MFPFSILDVSGAQSPIPALSAWFRHDGATLCGSLAVSTDIFNGVDLTPRKFISPTFEATLDLHPDPHPSASNVLPQTSDPVGRVAERMPTKQNSASEGASLLFSEPSAHTRNDMLSDAGMLSKQQQQIIELLQQQMSMLRMHSLQEDKVLHQPVCVWSVSNGTKMAF